MLDFQFSTPANIFFGTNSVEQLPKLIGANIRKVMLVYGISFARPLTGTAEHLKQDGVAERVGITTRYLLSHFLYSKIKRLV